jgi:hypothetical protein
LRTASDYDVKSADGQPARRCAGIRRGEKQTSEILLSSFPLLFGKSFYYCSLRSQIATSSSHGGRRYRPHAFTEYGALMAANILNSPRAVQMSIFVVRAFAKMREALRGTPELARKLTDLEKKLTARLDVHEAAIVQVLREVMQILNPPPEPEPPARRRIGFHES